MGTNGKTPRGGVIRLPIPTMEDISHVADRPLYEAVTFYTEIQRVPTIAIVLSSVKEKAGIEAHHSVMTMLEILNRTCLRENR